jgi:phenylacetate-CoA ligase
MDRVVGRNDDMLIVRGVNVFPSQIETALLQVDEVEPHYQIIVDRSADFMDDLTVLVEVPAEIHRHHGRLTQLQKRLCDEMQSALGITCHIKLVGPQELERSEGKAVRVLDKRRL